MIKENVKIMNWRNGFLLSLVSYILYLIIWLILDDETANQLPGMATVDYVVDFLLCMLFTYISLGFSWLSLKPWGIALKFLFLHHENILFPND